MENQTQRYDRLLELGHRYQDYVMTLFLKQRAIPISFFTSKNAQYKVGECMQGIEIKLDQRFRASGKLYIEYAERRTTEGNWVKSGVFRDDNSWAYAIGDEEEVFVFGKKQLQKELHNFDKVETLTSKGFLLPLDRTNDLTLFTLKPEPVA